MTSLAENTATPVDALVAEMSGRGLGAFGALPIHALLHLCRTLQALQKQTHAHINA